MLKDELEKEIGQLEKSIQLYSNELGDKIRINQEEDEPELVELKKKLTGGLDSKDKPEENTKDGKKSSKPQKKPKKSKNKTDPNWYNLDGIYIYSGMSLQGELEIYFKGLEELKTELETKKKNLKMLDNIIDKGLKKDMGCIAFQSKDGMLQISFLKSEATRKNFSFESVLTGKAISLKSPIEIQMR